MGYSQARILLTALTLIAFKKGDYKTAETSIRKAIALDPTNPNYQEGLKQIQKIKSQQ